MVSSEKCLRREGERQRARRAMFETSVNWTSDLRPGTGSEWRLEFDSFDTGLGLFWIYCARAWIYTFNCTVNKLGVRSLDIGSLSIPPNLASSLLVTRSLTVRVSLLSSSLLLFLSCFHCDSSSSKSRASVAITKIKTKIKISIVIYPLSLALLFWALHQN